MLIPIRCFSCGKVISGYYEEFVKRLEKGEEAEKILDDMKIERYCCRRMLLSQVDLIDEIIKYA
ncbi:DNA-directed RNA polymerase subunit N [Candidatus Micrarchaeota archaeon]|nr:DNA-directed RNA polymerase subunit N [Candidatus Micrarchaeota archaeon]